METTSVENSQAPEDMEPKLLNHGDTETKCDVTEEELGRTKCAVPEEELERTKCDVTEEELRSIIEVIASTGKFWHDWDTLKGLLSFRLKQVLADYPEAQGDHDQQSSSLGETYADLVKRLDEALSSFIEGPPFTLQRLCEILLAARSIYPNLSKLALALEKNLLVTSTLTICMDPYPLNTTQNSNEPDKKNAEPLAHSLPLQNGAESVIEDEDEEMADAEEIGLDKDVEQITEETLCGTAEASSEQNIKSTEETMSGRAEASSEQKIESIDEAMNETAEASSKQKIESTEETMNGTTEVSSEHDICESSVELAPSSENVKSTC